VDTPFWLDELEAEQIVVATDGSGRGLLPELDDAVWPARGEAVTTEPVGVRLFECPHYARHGFDYWQQVASRDGTWIAAGYSGHGNVLASCAASSSRQRCRVVKTRCWSSSHRRDSSCPADSGEPAAACPLRTSSGV
jgi:hypothetical protein